VGLEPFGHRQQGLEESLIHFHAALDFKMAPLAENSERPLVQKGLLFISSEMMHG